MSCRQRGLEIAYELGADGDSVSASELADALPQYTRATVFATVHRLALDGELEPGGFKQQRGARGRRVTVYTVRTGKPRPPRELLVGIARQLEYLTRRVEDIAARL